MAPSADTPAVAQDGEYGPDLRWVNALDHASIGIIWARHGDRGGDDVLTGAWVGAHTH